MKLIEGFVVCEVGGKTVAVASGELSKKFNGMITLNGTGKLLFEKLQAGCTREDLIFALTGQYGVSEETAAKDVDAYLAALEAKGLLTA